MATPRTGDCPAARARNSRAPAVPQAVLSLSLTALKNEKSTCRDSLQDFLFCSRFIGWTV
jgi:hypothetical protein